VALKALITRPAEDAKALADGLVERGLDVVVEPLLTIAPLQSVAGELARDLQGVQAILFTSANGVRAFAQLSARRDIGVLAVGDATAAAARSAGFGAVESAGGDVKDLARLAKQRLKPEGGPLFHGAGSAVAGDLAQLLAEAGFSLRRRMLYESQTARGFAAAAEAALRAGAIDLVLLFSPRTAATFAALAKGAGIDLKAVSALCLSPAVAAALGGLSWRAIESATRPDLSAMLALVDRQITDRQDQDRRISDAKSLDRHASDGRPPAKPEAESAMTNSPPSSPSPNPPAQPAPTARTPVPAPRRGGGGAVFLAGLIGALIAGGGMLAVLRYAPERLGIAQPAANDAAAGALGDLAKQVADLQQQVNSLPKPGADSGPLADRLAALQADVTALKSSGMSLPAEISGLPQRLSDLEGRMAELKPTDLAGLTARIAALEQRPAGNASPADSAALAQLKSEVAAFEVRLKAAESAMAELATLKQGLDELAAASARSGAANAGAAMALSLDAIQRRIAEGKPFAAELDALARLASGAGALGEAMAPSLALLKPLAGGGVATLASLQESFPAAAEAISRAAETSADNAATGTSFTDRVLARLAALVTIRPVGEGTQGDDPPARLARAEARLNAGDIEGAAGELAGLPAGALGDAAKPWLDRAQARLAAERELDKLQGVLIAALAKAGGAPQ
jgi:uroporphyrinogen-III synthase